MTLPILKKCSQPAQPFELEVILLGADGLPVGNVDVDYANSADRRCKQSGLRSFLVSGHAAVDLFTCGEDVDPWKCYYYLLEHLKAKHSTTIELRRGTLNTPHLRHKPAPVKVAA